MTIPREDTVSRFRPEDYRAAAAERLRLVDDLLEREQFGMAVYFAGVVAECVVRAALPRTEAFSGRHDLAALATQADFWPRSLDARPEVTAAIQTLRVRWRNNYRYMADGKIGLNLSAAGCYPQLNGVARILRRAAQDCSMAAHILFQYGVGHVRPPHR